MLLRFSRFELDGARFELRENGAAVPVEPQVLSLLLLLAGNRERLVGKDEIIDKVWNGRFVSESAVSSRVKAGRRALGDDGRAQRMIRTIHGKGFRFVHAVEEAAAVHAEADEALRPEPPARPSIAVLPFRLVDP
jgi:DNA-binding winged helix-turn-helix (wHTH) protein